MPAIGYRSLGGLALIQGLLFLAFSDVVRADAKDHPIVLKAGQTTASAQGKLSKKVHEVYFSLDARAGQHLFVKIAPLTPDLVTAGVVFYPSGKQDGGPGGVIFDSDLIETGRYRIRVTQRQGERSGKFRLSIELKEYRAKEASRLSSFLFEEDSAVRWHRFVPIRTGVHCEWPPLRG